MIIWLSSGRARVKVPPKIECPRIDEIDDISDSPGPAEHFKIYAAHKFTNKFDGGPFIGWAIPEAGDGKGIQPIVIAREDGAKLGYIHPDKIQKYYALAEPGKTYPVIGTLIPYANGHNKCSGQCVVLFTPSPDDNATALLYSGQLLYRQYGSDTVPKRLLPK